MPEPASPARTAGLDRRRDLAGWALTPLVTLVLGPLLAGSVAVLALTTVSVGEPSAICEQVAATNRCEETTLAMAGGHVAVFGGLWALLWLTPWWRGLRTARIVVAVAAVVVLMLVPLRMADLA